MSITQQRTAPQAIGLGLDVGGTATRWALVQAAGPVLAEGELPGMPGRPCSDADWQQVQATLSTLAEALQAHTALAALGGLVAGITGFDPDGPQAARYRQATAAALGLPVQRICLADDIVMGYLSHFAPGEGYMVYAGTGSMSAYIDEHGHFHRVGGRGHVLDDGGSAVWMVCQAFKQIWRREDEAPGSWQQSALARELMHSVGGSQWAATRAFIYGQERGAIGQLAQVIAGCAERDPLALTLLQRAGDELAWLAQVHITRHGPRPVVLSGRAAGLHPSILASAQARLGADIRVSHRAMRMHLKAAELARAGPACLDDILHPGRQGS